MQIDYEDMRVMGNQIDHLINLYKEYVAIDLRTMLYAAPNKTITLRDDVWVDCWNRGYGFLVKSVKLRDDDSVMIVGEYCEKEDDEFLSYINNFKQIKQIADQILI